MIKGKQQVSLAQVKDMIKKDEEGQQELREYLRKFTKLSREKAEKLTDEIKKLGNVKIKEADAIKVADFLPKNVESLNKIFIDASLNEEEANAVLDIVKKY